MTPFARRVMEKVRQRDHGTYERWFQAIVDTTVDEVSAKLAREWPGPASTIVRALNQMEPT